MRVLLNVDVPDLTAAVDFYGKVFDLKCNRIIDDDVAEMVGASSVIYLLQKESDTQCFKNSSATREYKRHWTPLHVDFIVEDIELAKERAINAGAVCESDMVEWLGSKCITFSDPFGHGFCFIEFAEETYSSESRL